MWVDILYILGSLPACYHWLRVAQLHVAAAACGSVKWAVGVYIRRVFHIIIAWEWYARTFLVFFCLIQIHAAASNVAA